MTARKTTRKASARPSSAATRPSKPKKSAARTPVEAKKSSARKPVGKNQAIPAKAATARSTAAARKKIAAVKKATPSKKPLARKAPAKKAATRKKTAARTTTAAGKRTKTVASTKAIGRTRAIATDVVEKSLETPRNVVPARLIEEATEFVAAELIGESEDFAAPDAIGSPREIAAAKSAQAPSAVDATLKPSDATVAKAPTPTPTRAQTLSVTEAARRIGIETLHPEQTQGIEGVLDNRDVLMILPTGFGKSACYQIPSMVLPKPTVVISPLLALLRDQHQKLIAHDVPCVRIDGTIRGKARREALERIAIGGPLLVMTTPETLFTEALGDALLKSGISLAAVDEAHCISEWGHDFRPTYQRLGTRLGDLGRPPILALTATATSRVRDAIIATLHMDDPTFVLDSPHRSNLSFEVIPCEGDMRLRALVRLVRRLRRPGIIYCSTRREVDENYLILRKLNIPSHRYHGAMPAAERDREQKKFMQRGRRTVMVATNAFGLGIDKRDIRYILHYQSPASLEQYVQEAGRGGRDGRKANCILLHDPGDRAIHEALQARSRIRPDQLYRIGNALAAWDDEDKKPSLQALALSAELGPRVSGALIAKLEEAGLVEVDKEGVSIIGERETLDADTYKLASQFDTLRIQDARRLDSLTGYANNVECRAVYLREYFGEEPGEDCGLCDVCEGRPERADGFFAPVKAPPKTVTKKKKPAKKVARSRREGTSRRRRRGRGGRGRRGRGRGQGSGDSAGPSA